MHVYVGFFLMNPREEGKLAAWSPIRANYEPTITKSFLEDSVVLKRAVSLYNFLINDLYWPALNTSPHSSDTDLLGRNVRTLSSYLI
jgi:hypothetical protein